jgi:hypothetical protein
MFENAKLGYEVTTAAGVKGVFVEEDAGSSYPYHIRIDGTGVEYTVNKDGRFALAEKNDGLDIVSVDSPVPSVTEEIETVDVTLDFTTYRVIITHPDGLIVQILKDQIQEIRDKQVLLLNDVIYTFTKDTTELITAWLLDEEHTPEVFLVEGPEDQTVEIAAEVPDDETVGSVDVAEEPDYNTPVTIGYGTKK